MRILLRQCLHFLRLLKKNQPVSEAVGALLPFHYREHLDVLCDCVVCWMLGSGQKVGIESHQYSTEDRWLSYSLFRGNSQNKTALKSHQNQGPFS